MRHYETIYIVNPELSQGEYREVLDRYSSLIEKNQGVLIKTEEWGIQRLAYELKKFDKGGYVLLDYCGKPGLSADLERDLSLNDKVLKFQTIKLANQADPQALLQMQKEKEVKVQAPEPEEEPSEGPEEEEAGEAAGAPEGEERGDV